MFLKSGSVLFLIFFDFINSAELKYVSELVTGNGYPIEVHSNVQTTDGYLLTMHRIPHGKNPVADSTKREPILLMHGFLGSAEHYLWLGPEKGLAYLLADRGFDVWLGNVRSVSYSRHHTTLNPNKDKAYWDFSLHELGVYDLTAKIDYILKQTGFNQIQYLAHSQGCVIFSIMCSEVPEYNSKVKLFVALAPTTYAYNAKHPWLDRLATQEGDVMELAEIFQIHEIAPARDISRAVAPIICALPAIDDVCVSILFAFGGIDYAQFNKTYLPNIVKNIPEGISTKQFFHRAQNKKAKRFGKYDYGSQKNLEVYGSEKSPTYNISLITVPTAIYYAKKDWFVSPSDIERFSKELPNVIENYMVNYENFTHIDFVVANDIKPLLYDRVLSLIDKYKSN